ncbi:MAG: 1-deoxy-D-xylulose-5-phosphate synthase [Bacillota bacterium]|nr:1-deoxy-D-xylulose-5-phosphate synthase [Bacillota bacterium]
MPNMLDNYNDIAEIKKMSFKDLDLFANDIRQFLIEKVSKTGGHLASNLGVVELTLSLFKVFNFDKDKIVWDVGHQSYVHKILTGRKDKFDSLRKFGGISGFPKRSESKYDAFDTGHSSTSISAALGIARARDLNKGNYEVVALIGDGALTGGMAFEALNDAAYNKTKMIIILNDNQMSIAQNVGGMSTYLSKLRVDPKYNKFKDEVNDKLRKTNIGNEVANSIQKIKGGLKQIIVPGMLFEDMGIKYFGPIDGHNIKELVDVFTNAKNIKGPVIIHAITKKGKGYDFAEKNPNKFHGIGPFDSYSGECCSNSQITYSKAFGEELVNIAEEDKRVVAITAAMPDGTGLSEFSKKYKNRFFDVGIAEQHAVTMAAGMASEGFKPVFAVYSTFLQRAYDQIIHDVCMQKLPVIFAIDRAGIVGEDGETHQGVFDLSYLSHMPNMTIMSPKCVSELKPMLRWALKQTGPIAIRYPRGSDICDVTLNALSNIRIGKWEEVTDGKDIAIIGVGKMVQSAVLVRERLERLGISAKIISASFIKPLDIEMMNKLINDNYKIITIEDNVVTGGFGAMFTQHLNTIKSDVKVLNLGFQDEFIQHGGVDILYKLYNLDVEGIFQSILKFI